MGEESTTPEEWGELFRAGVEAAQDVDPAEFKTAKAQEAFQARLPAGGELPRNGLLFHQI